MYIYVSFPISRDPPEGGTSRCEYIRHLARVFPISRDPPEGGTGISSLRQVEKPPFPISRDPPEGGTSEQLPGPSRTRFVSNF